jgi:dephospho-CoA kinase
LRTYKLVGLTGRTGSGKSIAREVFEESGYKVIDADSLAREAIENRLVKGDILAVFGVDLLKDGDIDRGELAKRAFKNADSVKTLNSIIHPRIVSIFLNRLKTLCKEGDKKFLFDAPQLFEAGLDVVCDSIVALGAPEKVRIERITERDGITEEMAKSRLRIQLSDSFFKENCDYYIENDSSIDKMKAKVREIIPQV